MSKKNKAITIVITLILAIFVFLVGFTNNQSQILDIKYQVYLDGKSIGVINSADDLYELINQEQSVIKSEYNVDQVYPPKGFDIKSYLSYDDNVDSISEIYEEIKNNKSFTVKGYTASITEVDENGDSKIKYKINVLDKQVFEDAIQKFVKSFISEEQYTAYMNDTQAEIKDTGSRIENLYFNESITIKEAYLSTEDKIFTDSDELTRYLMFDDSDEVSEYTVKKGDTIEKIAYDNKLNTSEFLIANPQFTSESNMLAVGEKVNVALIDPKLTFVVEKYVVEDTEVKYDTIIKYDSSKPTSYKVTETKGVNGIQRVAKVFKEVNGNVNEDAYIDKDKSYMIKEAVDEVIVRGNKSYNASSITGTYYDDGSNWAWPTNVPYTLSSPYGYRWGTFHAGQDITGTGYGSPIYAIGAGVVRDVGYHTMVGSAAGLAVVIEHPNGYWSVYAHLSSADVKVGQVVSRKEKIGAMGKSGVATGTHLHLTISIGQPYKAGSKFIDPMTLWSK